MEFKIPVNLSDKEVELIRAKIIQLLPEGKIMKDEEAMEELIGDFIYNFICHQIGKETHEGTQLVLTLWLNNCADDLADMVREESIEYIAS